MVYWRSNSFLLPVDSSLCLQVVLVSDGSVSVKPYFQNDEFVDFYTRGSSFIPHSQRFYVFISIAKAFKSTAQGGITV